MPIPISTDNSIISGLIIRELAFGLLGEEAIVRGEALLTIPTAGNIRTRVVYATILVFYGCDERGEKEELVWPAR